MRRKYVLKGTQWANKKGITNSEKHKRLKKPNPYGKTTRIHNPKNKSKPYNKRTIHELHTSSEERLKWILQPPLSLRQYPSKGQCQSNKATKWTTKPKSTTRKVTQGKTDTSNTPEKQMGIQLIGKSFTRG